MRIFITASPSPPARPGTLAPDTPPVTLGGEITRADPQTYRELRSPPPGTRHRHRLQLQGQPHRNRPGLRDPKASARWERQWTHIEISDTNARRLQTRQDPARGMGSSSASPYPHCVISATKPPSFSKALIAHIKARLRRSHAPARGSTPTGRGDFNHTAHSDGSCDAGAARIPCPPQRTFEAARDASLDFVAITDHNTITQLPEINAYQAQFPETLLIPGTEITTFNGHANVIGNTSFLDFQLGSARLPTPPLFDQVKQQDAFISVNHPGLPSGEICMGCGWTVKDTDWSRVTAIEVINGSTLRTGGAEGPTSGIRFWDTLAGRRITPSAAATTTTPPTPPAPSKAPSANPPRSFTPPNCPRRPSSRA
jgi:hypothetical protein